MILILDFGSQYTQLIARRIRELKVYCEIHPYNISTQSLNPRLKSGAAITQSLKGVILSGGPSSVYEKSAPKISKDIYELGMPILGICYGMQHMVHQLGGVVNKSKNREYGLSELKIKRESQLFSGLSNHLTTQLPNHLSLNVWMSHGDRVMKLPEGFSIIGSTQTCPIAAVENKEKKFYGLQFHPEVKHTPEGKKILRNFVFKVCNEKPNWTMQSFISKEISEIKKKVNSGNTICALSGGVDSSVTATLVNKAIGKKLYFIFVDTGLLPIGEKERVKRIFGRYFGKRLLLADERERFIRRLKGVTDPEEKRRIIGREFISVFEKKTKRIKPNFLVQGTLYPDVIESVNVKGPSAKIKTHHNVGGLPKKMKLKLIEPLKQLFKDEVRQLGKQLGLPSEILNRHPFPGPGLAVRIIGEVTGERVGILQKADKIVEEEIVRASLYESLWQAFAVLLPVKTVGVMGDKRTYENVVAVRIVNSSDAMTADWARIPYEVLGLISNRIINEVKGVNRVVYDISSKPPATIEWE